MGKAYKVYRLTVGSGSQFVVGPNPRRTRVYVSFRADETITVNFGAPVAGHGDGWMHHRNAGAIVLDVADIGDGIKASIYVYTSIVQDISVVEVYDDA